MSFTSCRSERRSLSFSALAFLLSPALFAPMGSHAEELPSTAKESCVILLREEVRLAEALRLYVIVDEAKRRLVLKAKGTAVREFPVRSLDRVGGSRERGTPYSLLEKKPFIEPAPRMLPNPSIDSRVAEDSTPLNVSAMPVRYELVFTSGFSLLVHPGGADSPWRRILDRMGGLSHRVKAHAFTWGGKLWGEPRKFLLLEMSPEESQAFYWALNPTMKVLIRQDSC